MSSTLTCGVLFESDPVWLWSIRPNSWSIIFITGPDDVILRQVHPALFKLVSAKLVIIPSTFENDFPSIAPDFMWISGCRSFIERASSSMSSGTHVFWMSNSPRRCPTDLGHIAWSRISHRNVGGVTEARGTFGIGSPSTITLPQDLKRSIGHIVNFSIRPKVSDPDTSEDHYKTSDLLSLSFPRRPILYSTHMSRTGWGLRALGDSELAMCFELPEFLLWEDRFLRDIVPLQLFRSVIDSVSELFSPPPPKRVTMTPLSSTPVSTFDSVWLESIGKWMPGSWADAEIADKAVKSDNAPVDFKPWHRRIQLVFPCSTSTLGTIERFGARRWRFNVCRSLFSYLRMRYGVDWHIGIVSSSKRSMADPLPVPSKRSRTSVDSVSMGSQRGVGWVCEEVSEASVRDLDAKSLFQDVSKGLRVVGQVLQSTWWEWTGGSSPLFWRWNGIEQVKAARDGMHIFLQAPLPRSQRGAKLPRFDMDTRKVVSSKIESMIDKSYLEVGRVQTFLHYFAVPKGDSDVRVVFDGTSCGLNETLWSPNFFLPTSRNAAELLSFDSWMSDVDFGEFFHNFFADERVRKHAGVNISVLSPCLPAVPAGPGENLRLTYNGLRWSRLFMGMRPSPYNAVRFYYWGEEFAKANLRDLSNPFGFDKVILNLPGMETYDTLLPKIVKWNSKLASMSGEVITFVDDVRIVGSSREHSHLVHRQFTSRMQYLGIQDAPRKFRPPSQDQAGAWTGTIFKVTKNAITKTVSQEKWLKGKVIVQNLSNLIKDHPIGRPPLNRKELERHTGFLNHLSMTFDDMTPFLKGFYLTLNSWRSKRDANGWKMSDKTWMECLVAQFENGSISDTEFENEMNGQNERGCPANVTASIRLGDDVRALYALFDSSSVPEVNLRSKSIISVIYGFGDASGTGLGATFTCGSGFTYRVGVWGPDESDQSSNWREFTNIVESLEEEASAGNLDKSEVFMFTDNSTVESCSVKGTSTSPKLLDLIIRLRALSTSHGIKIHIFHVAGTRMIAQGTDGVSRGFLGEGIMGGQSMKSFIPIHMTALERSPALGDWITSWTTTTVIFLEPRDWFDVGHDIDGWSPCWDSFYRPRLNEGRVYLWTPPPFAADIAIAELRKARIKRQTSTHVFAVPRLCAPLWMKQVFKAADFVFEIPAGHSFWGSDMHEPLLIAIVFPFLRSKPWQLRATPKMYEVGGQLHLCRRMWCGSCYTSNNEPTFHISDEENLYVGEGDEDRLRAGWKPKPSDHRKYSEARDGDDLMISFECDYCVFAKITGRLPNLNADNDTHLMGCIRRVILDAFWSRARQTVSTNACRFREMVTLSASLGFEPPYDSPGPLPSFDHCGYKVAILMVEKSLQPGRHSESYTQWDTIRKFKSTHSNQSRSARTANSMTLSMTDAKGSGLDRFSTEVCGSLWFQRFSLGCRKRMGQDWRPNRAISNPLMIRLLSLIESKIRLSSDSIERLRLVMAGSYFCFCYVVSLRSPEGLMIDVPGLCEFGEKNLTHVVIPLLGQVKGEDHTRQHLLHCVNVTDSGIQVRSWVRRLKSVHLLMRRSSGPAFVNTITQKQSTTSEMNDIFLELLSEILEDDRDLFAVDIQSSSDLFDKYNVFRSFRRGSESRAVDVNVSEGDRFIVNRWRKNEKAGSSKIALSIDQYYVDVSLAKDPFLRYTKAM